MSCLSCGSSNGVKFSAETMIHFPGFKNLDKPGVWVFPEFLICLDCGFSQFSVPVHELWLLASGTGRTTVQGRS